MWRGRRGRAEAGKVAKLTIEKVWDPSSQQYFFYNTATGQSSWQKPRVVSGEADICTPRSRRRIVLAEERRVRGELRSSASMSRSEAARIIQGMYRSRAARRKLRDLVLRRYEQARDASGRAYFYDRVTGQSSWDAPLLWRPPHGPESEQAAHRGSSAGATRAGSSSQPSSAREHLEWGREHSKRRQSSGVGPDGQRVSTLEVDDSEEVRRRAARRGARGAKAVAAFLKAYKLDMLLDLLLREGFDDMNALIAIQESDIDELGVKRRLRRPLFTAVLEYRKRHDIVDPLEERTNSSDEDKEEGKLGRDGEEEPSLEPDEAERQSKLLESKSAALEDDDDEDSDDEEDEGVESDHDSVKGDDDIPGVEIVSVFKGDGVHFPRKGQFALVHYVASLDNGTIIESSRKRGRPLDFLVGARHVVPGLDKAIRRLSRGERANVTLAPELAYGPKGRPPVVPPNARIRLEVELIDNYFAPVGELVEDDELEHEEHEGATGRRAVAAAGAGRGGDDGDGDDDDA